MIRLVSGAALAVAFFAIVWFSNTIVLLLVALVVAALAFHEYAELMRAIGAALPRLPSLAGTLAVVVAVSFDSLPLDAVLGLSLVLIAATGMLTLGRDNAQTAVPGATPSSAPPAPMTLRFREAAAGVLAGGLSLLYLGVPLGSLVGTHLVGGRGAVVLLVGAVAISDTAQYYAGRAFGRRRLAPVLSPKKTVEGALGGLIAGPLFLFVAGSYFVPAALPSHLFLLGLVLVPCGIAGDLFESMFKRAAAIKDSSALIPGHGGVLDRIDALLFAAPVFYWYVRWVYSV
jgi:CDP-diglyceride synthetase